MKDNEIQTYENLKKVYTIRNIDKGDILEICSRLTEEYANNGLDHELFEPEPITEGGILFSSHRGKAAGVTYKSIRFLNNRSWPMIKDPWEKYDTGVAVGGLLEISLFLKAFHGAPKWTAKEKKIFLDVLDEYGFSKKKINFKSPKGFFPK